MRKPMCECIGKRLLIGCMAVALCFLAVQAVAQQGPVMFPDYYPETFSGFGRIDQIGEKAIVLDDRKMTLSDHVTYHTLSRQFVSREAFKPKIMVGYIVDSDNEIVSLWFIQK